MIITKRTCNAQTFTHITTNEKIKNILYFFERSSFNFIKTIKNAKASNLDKPVTRSTGS